MEKNKKRGALLTIWLVIMLIANTYTSYTFLKLASSEIGTWIYYAYSFVGLLNAIFAISLFMWKKWAFYAFCGSSVLAIILNLTMNTGIFAIFFGIAGPTILYLFMRSKWKMFK